MILSVSVRIIDKMRAAGALRWFRAAGRVRIPTIELRQLLGEVEDAVPSGIRHTDRPRSKLSPAGRRILDQALEKASGH